MFDGLEVISTKTCNRCLTEKPFCEFPKNPSSKTGIHSVCKACNNTRLKSYREELRTKPRPVVESKVCTGCQIEKPTGAFSKNQGERNGLSSRCKECVSDYQTRRKALLQSSGPLTTVLEKACTVCGEVKPASSFLHGPLNSDGLRSQCKDCSNRDQREWRENFKSLNPKEFKAREMMYGAKERAKKNDQKQPFDLTVDHVLTVFPDTCPYLGIPMNLNASLLNDDSPTLDKIDPKGGYVVGNVEVISFLANRIKSNASPEQVLAVGHRMREMMNIRSVAIA